MSMPEHLGPAPRGARRARRVRTVFASVASVASAAVATAALAACGSGSTDEADQTFVVPTFTQADDGAVAGEPVASEADVLRAADAAVAAAGGEAIRAAVDLMGYVVQIRQDGGAFSTVQLDVGFGIVFVEDLEPGRRAAELAADVDLRRAVELALEVALGEPIGAAGDGIVVGAELEPDGYDIDIQYPDGRVLEVRLDDTWNPTGTRIRGG